MILVCYPYTSETTHFLSKMSSQTIKPQTLNHPNNPPSAKPPSPSHFLYVPACSRASRRDIEESSYDTTPDLSEGEETPPCGQMTYLPGEELSSEEDLGAVDAALRRKILKDRHKRKHKTKNHGGLERVVLLEADDEEAKEVKVGKEEAKRGDHEEITTYSPAPGPGQKETESLGAKKHVKGSMIQRASIDIVLTSDQGTNEQPI